MLAYNYTRYSAGRRIARLHLKVISDVEALTKHRRINTEDEIFPFKFEVQSKFVRELKKIAEVEEAAIMMRTSVLVGYLSRERREQLSNHFRGFDVESHPICTALDPLI
uniref:Transposase n=1 Tax=Heterorhabditis bacteriophora TaxID=37862 RepID=A0A1I7WP85_HETBA